MMLIYYTLAMTSLFLFDAQSAVGTWSAASSSAPVAGAKDAFSNAGDIRASQFITLSYLSFSQVIPHQFSQFINPTFFMGGTSPKPMHMA